MSWSKQKPEPPPTGSEWYWYWDPQEKAPWVTEIYKGCWKYYDFDGFWWDEPVSRPPESPTFKEKKTRKRKYNKKKRQHKEPSKEKEMISAVASMPAEPSSYKGKGLL